MLPPALLLPLLLPLLLLAACTPVLRPAPPAPPPAPPPVADRLDLAPATFAALPGWDEDRVGEALPALLRSCGHIARAAADGDSFATDPRFGRIGDWRQACAAVQAAEGKGEAAVRAAIEAAFTPFAATAAGRDSGLFTGYYEPLLQGSRRQGRRYTVPLYRRPPDLIDIDLGRFAPDLAGRRIAGKLNGGALEPYPSRREIDQGALQARQLELVWVESAVDAFFLQVQGSGRVRLAEGGEVRVGYAGSNGRAYAAIGRVLAERGEIPPGGVTMQSIRAWLAANPARAQALLWENPSFVFFRELTGDGPVGAQGVALVPERSLAVDPRFVPLSTPLWLAATAPSPRAGAPDRPYRRLLVAQDVGGAIKGPLRGDVFFGFGPDAESVAGRMQHQGRLFLLLPRAAAARVATR
ncbi:MAG: murein transglycosylase [Alphaproteobacteria bacterium]|nr:murein transglycosylase [Alphaproteobacteria bacterium]